MKKTISGLNNYIKNDQKNYKQEDLDYKDEFIQKIKNL